MSLPQTPSRAELIWRDSDHICTIADDERHFGHVVQLNRWNAYDATKLNAAGDGFRYLGEFDTVCDAKDAVEVSIAAVARPEIKKRQVETSVEHSAVGQSKEICRRLRQEGF